MSRLRLKGFALHMGSATFLTKPGRELGRELLPEGLLEGASWPLSGQRQEAWGVSVTLAGITENPVASFPEGFQGPGHRVREGTSC